MALKWHFLGENSLFQHQVLRVRPSLSPAAKVGHLFADEASKNTTTSYAMVNNLRPIKVFCDLESDPFDGWTVIMQRINMDVDFNRTWREYKSGFGKMEKGQDFWLGELLKRGLLT